MIALLFPDSLKPLLFIGLFLSFFVTFLLTFLLKNILPRDGGRAFALNGALSQGKPRGAGIVFILTFTICSMIFVPFEKEHAIYYIMIVSAMLSGYFDDAAKKPWSDYKKAIIDLAISIVTAVTFVTFNSPEINFLIIGKIIVIPKLIYIILAVILIWVSINVTNCTDGVDGLSGSLAIVTLMTFYLIIKRLSGDAYIASMILIMTASLLAYLWYNASPSKLLMGDAGSRAIGVFIAIVALKTGSPILFIPVAAVFLFDGGLGLIKVFLLRFLKIHILKNTRTPLHDHVRKNKGWSDTQTVTRFVILQVLISFMIIFIYVMAI